MSHLTPDWMKQVMADLARHEGFREFAYPDPLSPLAKRFRRIRWGFVPAGPFIENPKNNINPRNGHPWTVGYGFTKQVTPYTRISRAAADKLLEQVILDHLPVLDKVIPNWRRLPLFAKSVVINMAFNLGSRLLQFKNSMAAIANGQYDTAARNLRKSLWAKQVGQRANELISRLERRAIAKEHLVV